MCGPVTDPVADERSVAFRSSCDLKAQVRDLMDFDRDGILVAGSAQEGRVSKCVKWTAGIAFRVAGAAIRHQHVM